jgi:hypothetical protein
MMDLLQTSFNNNAVFKDGNGQLYLVVMKVWIILIQIKSKKTDKSPFVSLAGF